MKKYLFLLAFLAISTFSFSQGFSWTFYSENGESFTLFIDSEKMNTSPQPRVVATGIKGIFKTVRIEFEDTRIPKVTKRVPLKPGLKEIAKWHWVSIDDHRIVKPILLPGSSRACRVVQAIFLQ